MANIRLASHEVEPGGLPACCMRCGEPSTIVKEKRFFWGPGWVMALFVLGALACGPLFWIALLLIPILLRNRLVAVPLCHTHRNHWLPGRVVLFGGLGLIVALIAATIVLAVLPGPGQPARQELAPYCAVGAFVSLIVMLFPAAILQAGTIKPTEITDNTIALTNVSRKFADALAAARRESMGPLEPAPPAGSSWHADAARPARLVHDPYRQSRPVQPKRSNALVTAVLAIGGAALLLMCFVPRFLPKSFHEDKEKVLAITPNEEVLYQDVSLESARRLGNALKDIGYFDGKSPKHVRLERTPQGYAVGFVVKEGTWDKPAMVDALRLIALQLAGRAFDGDPLELRLYDQRFIPKRVIPLKPTWGKALVLGPREAIYFPKQIDPAKVH